MSKDDIEITECKIEAILAMRMGVVPIEELRSLVGNHYDKAIQNLIDRYQGRGIHLVKTRRGISLRTAEQSSDLAYKLCPVVQPLTKAALETLAVIMIYGNVTRPEIEKIRGVQASPGIFDLLLSRNLIRTGARRDTPGRPLTFMVTDHCLEIYHLNSPDDLSSISDMKLSGLNIIPKAMMSAEQDQIDAME